MEVKFDKALYRQRRESMKEWDEAKMRARVRDAHTLTHAELWRQYVDLWEFGLKFARPTSKAQQAREMEEQADAYRKLEKFEEWRQAHGKKLEASLRVAVKWLEAHGYRYAVIGGIAVAQWGFLRATEEVDVKVLVSMADYAALRTQLRATFPLRAGAAIPENPAIVDVIIDGITVDFLFTIPGYDELVIERAHQRDLGGWEIWVCSTEYHRLLAKAKA